MLDWYGLYIDEHCPYLVALGRVYVGKSTLHNMLLIDDVWKAGVEEVQDATTSALIPIEEFKLVEQTLNTFIAWSRCLVKPISLKVYFTLVVFF